MKRVLRVFVFAAAFASIPVLAQEYPNRAVRMLVPNAPGSSIDTMSRIVAAKLGDAVADFAQVGSFAVTPNVLIVNPDLPVKSVKELIDYARANRATINMASAGVGSQSHLSGVLFMSMADFESLIVPHKGGGPSVNSVVAGQTHWTFTPAPAVMSFIKNGRLRALGQSLPRRSAMLGDIPPVADTVPGYDYSGWAGLVAPKGTPQAVIDKLHAALVKTLDLAEVKDGLAKQGAEVFTGSPEDFRKFLAQDQGNTVKVIKAAKLQAE